MSCQRNNSITLENSKLKEAMYYHLNIMLKGKRLQIIKGTVYNQKQKPSRGAVIQVTQISNLNRRSILGYCYTDENGKYLFAIEAQPYMKYEIAVYAPLSQ